MKLTKIILPTLLIFSVANAGFWDWFKYDNYARPKVAASAGAICAAAYKLDIFNTISSAVSAVKNYIGSSTVSKTISDITRKIDVKSTASAAGEVVKESNFSTSIASAGVTALTVIGAYYGAKYLVSKCWDFIYTNRDGKRVVITTTANIDTTTTARTTGTTAAA